MREVAALRHECERAEETLRGVPVDAWERPGLGEWNLHTLATHLTRTIGRLADYLGQPAEGPPAGDRVSMYRYDPAKVAPGVAQRAREEAAELPPAQLPDEFARVWREAVEKAAACAPGQIMPTRFGPMLVEEFTATRCVEAVVHHMDVRRALDLPPDPDPEAASIVTEILEGLLGDTRPRNLGRDRFILAATGRIPHDDPRFPVLA